MRVIIGLSLLCISSLTLGCDDPVSSASGVDASADGGHPDDQGADLGGFDVGAPDRGAPPATTVRYDLDAARAGDFFAFPYPSDLRRSGQGAPDLTGFPVRHFASELLPSAIGFIETLNRGFSPVSATYFSFTGPLDPSTLPQSPTETVAADATVYLVDVDPASSTYGRRTPATVTYTAEGGGHWPPNTLAVRPLYGVPLRPGGTYAAVITDGVRTPSGAALTRPPALGGLAEGEAAPPGTPASALAPLRAAIQGADFVAVIAASVFTTADPFDALVRLTTWMRDTLAPPTPSGWSQTDSEPVYTVYEGRFDTEEFFAGEAPYFTFGSGQIAVNADGVPSDRRPRALRFAVSVPAGAAPPGGWPVVLYAHGLGENYRGFVPIVAGPLATRGMAVIGINPPLQGERNPTETADRSLIIQLSISNIVAGREILRQGVCDTVQLLRLVEGGLTIPADISVTGAAVALSAARVAFMGHSEGGQIGALFMALDHQVRLGVISAGGAGAAITLLDLQLPEFDVRTAVSLALGIDEEVERFDLEHPIVNAVIQPLLDVADPLHAARRVYRSPGPSGPASVIMTEGFNDPLTPPRAIETLASVAGLPIAEPVGRAIEGLSLQGVDSVALPAMDNLESDAGEPATGALLQYPEGGHYLIYRSRRARAQIFEFLRRGLVEGRPEVVLE